MFTYFHVLKQMNQLVPGSDRDETIAEDYEGGSAKKNKSFWIVMIIWLLTLVVSWIVLPAYVPYHHLMVIIASIIQLVCTLFCEKEHINVMRRAINDDHYNWFRTGISLTVECIGELVIPFWGLELVSLIYGFPSVLAIYVFTMVLIIWIPRMLFKPW